jgi:4-diphosphocytidyl-2-C-methyl-D-erythritol kinase
MRKLSAKSYTRITLALDIVEKIKTGPHAGFHELAVIKHKINLHDVITIEESKDMRINCGDPQVPNNAANICWKACEILKNAFGIGQNVSITIEKNIPIKGGLAGGSSNAATTFMLLNELWKLDLDNTKLIALSRQAGMDVPFYFAGDTAFDTEAGGGLEPIASTLHFDAILVVPDFGVSTSEAYRELDYSHIGRDREKTSAMRQAFTGNDRGGVTGAMHNDFEYSVFRRIPPLALVKKRLIEAGCVNAVLSGSGSCVLGILETPKDYRKISVKAGMKSMLVASKPKGASHD